MDSIAEALWNEETQHIHGQTQLAHASAVVTATKAATPPKQKCTHCKKTNHTIDKCFKLQREKAKAEAYVAKRKEENAARSSQGLPPLPDEDIRRLFKIPPEPSRLESMLLLGQVDAYSKTLEGISGAGLIKMYGAKAGAGVAEA